MLRYDQLWGQVKPAQENDIRVSYRRLESLVSSEDLGSDEKFLALAKGILLRCPREDFCEGLRIGLEMNAERHQKKGGHSAREYVKGYVHTALALSLPPEESKSFTETFAL